MILVIALLLGLWYLYYTRLGVPARSFAALPRRRPPIPPQSIRCDAMLARQPQLVGGRLGDHQGDVEAAPLEWEQRLDQLASALAGDHDDRAAPAQVPAGLPDQRRQRAAGGRLKPAERAEDFDQVRAA